MSQVAEKDLRHAADRAIPAVALLKSLAAFDESEIAPILKNQFGLSPYEEIVVGMYLRVNKNVGSLLALNHIAHFQAAAMLARAVFELAVDLMLLDIEPSAVLKVRIFTQADRLRSMRKTAAYGKRAVVTLLDDTALQENYIQQVGTKVDAEITRLWPSKKNLLPGHWTGLDMSTRATRAGTYFEEYYHLMYIQLSWHVHGGLVGVYDLPPAHFAAIYGLALGLSCGMYEKVLQRVILRFRMSAADDAIYRKLEFAIKCSTLEQSDRQSYEALLQELGLSENHT